MLHNLPHFYISDESLEVQDFLSATEQSTPYPLALPVAPWILIKDIRHSNGRIRDYRRVSHRLEGQSSHRDRCDG